MAEDIKQPAYKTNKAAMVRHTPIYNRGSPNAVARLKCLGFDPIKKLVDSYEEIQGEIERQKKIRAGEIVELTATGKPRAYRAEIHHALIAQRDKIANDLLRYGYKRVPENDTPERKSTPTLTVELTAKGETYVVNPPIQEQPSGVPGEDDWDDHEFL